MAFGLTPNYIGNFGSQDLSAHQFIALAVETAKSLNWNINLMSESGIVAYTNKEIFKWNAKITVTTVDGIATVKSESVGSEMLDWGKNRKTSEQFIAAAMEFQQSLSKEDLDAKYEEIKSNITPEDQDPFKMPPETSGQKVRDFFSIFVPKKNFYITPVLIDLNFVVFILMLFTGANFLSPNNASLIKWGANFKPLTLDGQWWRLISNTFVHIGIIHLLFNMYALLYIGILLEPYLGKLRFAAAYLFTGIIASLTSLFWHDYTVSAGASGAIFGLYGIFLALLTTNIIDKSKRKPLLLSIGLFVVYNLANGTKSGIDNAAHIGGLLSGFVIGYCFYPGLKNPESKISPAMVTCFLALVVAVTTYRICKIIPNDIGKYDGDMKRFAAMESQALEVYKMSRDAPKAKIISEIKERSLYYWYENISLLNQMEQLHIPELLHDQDKKLKDYCRLRINAFTLMYKGLEENTDNYQDSITYYNTQIDELINSLNKKR